MLNFELLTSFIDTEFPNCVGAFVTGSYALGTNSPTSDIDIVIITRNGEPQTLECREFEGALLELSIFSQNECKHIFQKERIRRVPVFSQMCTTAVLLKDSDDFVHTLTQKGISNYIHGPLPAQKPEVEGMRFTITKLLTDFTESKNYDEGDFLIQQLIHYCGHLQLLIHGHWLSSGKWMYRFLDEINPGLITQIREGKREYVTQKNKEGIISFVRETLEFAGGPLSFGYTTKAISTNKPWQGLQIPFYDETSVNYKLIGELIGELKNNQIVESCFLASVNSDEKNAVLCLMPTSGKHNSQIIKTVERIYKSKNNSVISCPYAPDYTGLGGIKGLEISYRFYQNLTNVIIEINSHSKLESNQSFLIPLLLTNILMRCFSRNEEEFLLFWNDFHKYNLNKIERLEKYSTSGLSKSFLKNPLYHEYTSKLNKELLNTPNTKPFENILKQWEVNCKQIFTDLGKLYNSSELIGLSGNKDLPRLSHIRNLFANKILELFGLSPVQ